MPKASTMLAAVSHGQRSCRLRPVGCEQLALSKQKITSGRKFIYARNDNADERCLRQRELQLPKGVRQSRLKAEVQSHVVRLKGKG